MLEVFYISPYCEGDIGKGINRQISLLPDDSWVCLMDSDTLLLTSFAQRQIQQIIEHNLDYDLIGCTTNRLGSPYQRYQGELSENTDIMYHKQIALELAMTHGTEVEEVPEDKIIAGCLMLFRKSLWNEFPFEEKSIQFDIIFNQVLRTNKKRIGKSLGLYIFHMYRLGMDNPEEQIGHLVHCHDFRKTIYFER